MVKGEKQVSIASILLTYFIFYSRRSHNLEMSISLRQLQKEHRMYACPLQHPNHTTGILLFFHDVFLYSSFKGCRTPVFFIIIHSSKCFVIHLLKLRFSIFFFQDTDEENVKQHRVRADFHRAPPETHPYDDDSSLPVAFGDLSVSQLLIHCKYVVLIA